MGKILGIILGALALIAVGFLLLHARPARSTTITCASLTHKPVIAAFGDSLVYGYGAESQQGFVGPLSKEASTTIIDNGVSGNTTGEALARITTVLNEKPNIVIVLLGGNDALQQLPISTTRSNLQSIISQLQSQHIIVVLVGVLGGFPSDPFEPMFQSLAQTDNTLYVPNILNGLITNKKYMYDEVHPNATGYDIAAEKILPALNQACTQFAKT